MGLEHRDQSAWTRATGDVERDRELGRNMAVVVVELGASGLAPQLEPPTDAREARQRLRRSLAGHADQGRRHHGGDGVQQIVRAVHAELQRDRPSIRRRDIAAGAARTGAFYAEPPGRCPAQDAVGDGLGVGASKHGPDARVVAAGDDPLTTGGERAERGLDLLEAAGVEVDVVDIHVRDDADRRTGRAGTTRRSRPPRTRTDLLHPIARRCRSR